MNKEYKNMDDTELIHLRETNRQSHPIRHEAIKELHRRQKTKDRKNYRIIFWTLILTIIIIALTLWNTISPILF